MFRHSTVEFSNVIIDGVSCYRWVVELLENDERVGVHYYNTREEASLHSERFADGLVDA